MHSPHQSRHFLPSLFEQLEDRVLFDGVPDAAFVLPTPAEGQPQPAQVGNFDQSAHSYPTELIIIDDGVENSQQLLLSLLESNSKTSFEIRHINQAEDGVDQITELLNKSNLKYDAIHILSHGEAGKVALGSSVLSQDNVTGYLDSLVSWSESLSEDADILFYGCELAGNESGQSLIQTVSAVTGADVAASVDVTGSADQNANWNLEFSSGRIETLALSAMNWDGTLMVEATNGAVTIQDAEFTGSGTVSLVNNAQPESVTVINTPTRVGQMLERVWQFNEVGDVGRSTYVFDVSMVSGVNATMAAEFGLIVSDQSDLADGPNTTTLVASGYDAANGLVYFHQVDLNDGDYFGLATDVVLDNFSINPTATGLEDTAIALGLTLSPSLTDGGQLQDIIGTASGFRSSTAGTTTSDFFIPAGTTGIRISGFSTRDIGTAATDIHNDDYQFLNVSIDLGTETSNGYIGHIIDQGPARSDQFGWSDAPIGSSVLTGGGTITGDANDNIDPTFSIVDGVLMIAENHSLQTAYHIEFLTNATSSSEFIRTESAVLESGDQSDATLSIPANADFLVVNITDAQADSNFAIEYKGNSRIYIDLATLNASGVVAAQEGETDNRVVAYAFEDYDVSSSGVGSILSSAGTIVGDTTGQATVINDNQIYVDASGNLVINRNNSFAGEFNSLVTVEYYDRKDAGSSAEQLGESTDYGFFNSDPSNPTSTLEFDIPENATLGILNLTANGTNTNDTNENSGAAFAVIDLANGTSSGSFYFVRTANIADLLGWDATPFGTAFFDDPNTISNHNTINQFNDPFAGTAAFNLINGGTTLELAADSDSGGTGSFLDYYLGAQIEWFGAAPFEISGFTNGGTFSQGTLNPVTGNWELTIAEAQAGLSYIPPQHVSGTVPVDVTLRIGDESEVTSVTIQAVIDPISFAGIPDACGDEDTDISIAANVTPTFVDQDGSETVTSLLLSNIPIGHTISDGINSFTASAGNQSLDITAWDQSSIVYRANPDESGTFTIDLDVDWQDVGGGVTDTDSMSTTFDVVVKPVNDDPVAVDNNYAVLGNTTLNVLLATGLLINDTDADGDPLTVTNATPLSGPSNGSVTVNSDGTFTYIPTTGFSGTDSFVYQISDGNGGFDTATAFIDVSEPVTGPLDAIDDMETTNEEMLININVMANDALPTTGAFNIQSTTPPSNGTILVLPDGTIDYTPNTDFFGTDTFTYTLADASGRTDTATVTVTVVNVQDPPVANADSGSTNEDTTLPNIDILNNDSDPDNDMLTVTMATAANGMVVINPDGTIDYTPNPNFNGVDIVNYTISDGNGGTAMSTVQINVVPVSDPPTSADKTVGLNEDSSRAFVATDFAFADPDAGDMLVTIRIDTLPANGQLLFNGNPVMAGDIVSLTDINNSRLVFVPDPDGFGSPYTDFDFSVSDGTLYQVAPNTMTINVLPRQDPPVATDNMITVPEDSVGTPLGLATPTDVDMETLTATVTGLPTLGTVLLADGVTPVNNGDMLTMAQLTSLVYDAPMVFTAASAGSFTYDVTDGTDTDSGQVDITITTVNDPPVVDLNNSGGGVDYADTFTEGGPSVGIVHSTVEVADEDDTTLPTLKIDIDESTIVDAGDEFLTIGGTDFQLDAAANSTVAITVGGVSYDVSFVAATARLDIVRTDGAEMTIAEVEAILLDAVYRNDSPLPTVSDRVFDVCVNDGDVDSNIATSTISVVRDAETADWSITGSMMVVDGGNAAYVVTLSDPLRDGETASVDLSLADVDTTSADYGTLNAAVTAAVAAYSGPGSYAWNGTTLTFTSDGTGVTTGLNISLPTTPDGAYEGDEDYVISLSNPASTTGETIGVSTPNVTTTIKDNTPAPTITIGDGSATEGSPVEFLISLDVVSFEDIVLDLAATSGSATAVSDFETSNFEYFDGTAWQPAVSGTQVTIPAGTTSLQVRVDSIQEGLVEPDETFSLEATVVSGAVTNASDTGTGTIVNDDISLISIDDVSVDEDNGTMTFTISLDQSPTGPVSVDWATSNATATGGVDFTSASGTASFAAGQQTQTVTISITNDNLYEGPETFNVDLSNASGGTIVDAQGVGTIFDNGAGPNGTDDDRPLISIDDVTATEDTDPHAVFTISLSNPSVGNVVVSLGLSDVSAVNPNDYGPGLEYFDGAVWQPVTGNVTIPAGATSLQVRTPIVDDPFADSGETYSLVVTHVSGTTVNSGDTGTGTILDEVVPDPTEVGITGPASVNEGDLATYTVAITNAPLTDVTVTFTYSGIATGGSDYSGVASVTIPAGSTTATFDIPTLDDTLGEPLESFTVAIDTLTGGSLESLSVSTTDFEVTTDIIDDDVPSIMVTDVIVTEGTDAFAQFTVELSNPTFEDIDFSIGASGLSAAGETVDYGIIGVDELEVFDGVNWIPATAATIVAGDTTILLRTPIVDDALAEMTEDFNVTVTTTGGTTSNPSDTGVGTIQEDTSDPETILVSLTGPGSVVEGATTTDYTISLADSTSAAINAAEDITVTLSYSGTAADGSDFTGVMTVLIPAGSPDATFTLPTVNDSLYEGSEALIVTIDSVAGGGFEGIGIDTMANEVTTLIDDAADIPTVSVNDVTSIEDTDNFAVYTIELTNLSVEDVDVSLLLADGSALGGGVDYGAAAAGNLQVFNGTAWVDATTATIPAGSFTVQVRTPIVSDLIDEPTENYTLTVDVTAGTTTNIQVIGTGTIIDDDPAPDVTIDDATATEGDPLVFAVTLSNPSSQPIVLDFSATDTTAIALSDYAATPFEYSTGGGVTWIPAVGGTEVTIPATLTAIQVRVMTTEDMSIESTETMQLGIASVVSGLVGSTTDTAVGTILDDDTALVSIVANDPAAGEPTNDGQFTVTMTNPSDSPTVITYSVAGSATNGGDYTVLPGTVTIPAGQTSATIDVSVIDDVVIEGNEDVIVMLTSIASGDPQISIDLSNDIDTVTITDDDEATWDLTGVTTVNEGAIATYNLNLDGTLQSGESASVELSVGNNTTAIADYASFDTAVAAAVGSYTGPGSLTWDGTTLTFTSDGTGAMNPLAIDLMAVNDAVVEGVEDYTVSIAAASSSTGATVAIDSVDNSVTTQIQDTIDAAGTSFDKASWSITGATSVSESQTTTYTVTIDASLQSGEIATVEISLANVDTVAADLSTFSTDVANAVTVYNASGQPGSVAWDGTTLTFTSAGNGPMGDLEIQVSAISDGFLEGPEDYSVQLSNAASTTGACVAIDPADTVTTTINPDVTSAEWSIGVDNAGDEGDSVQYTVSLSQSFGAGESAEVDLMLGDVDTNSTDYGNFVTAVNAAVAAYAGPGTLVFDGTTLTFTAGGDGDAMTDLVIDLQLQDDAIAEGTETFTVGLSNAAGPTGVNVSVSTTDDSVTTTINDTMGIGGTPDVATWSITGPAAGDEGTTATYTVSLAGALGDGESASVVIGLNDLTTNSSDYASIVAAVTAAAAANPDVTFNPGTGTLTYTAPSDGATMTDLVIDLGLAADAVSEGPEDFEIGLSAPTSATGAAVVVDGTSDLVNTTINDMTTPPQWAITGAVTADEGASAQYTVTLTGGLGAGETATVEIDLTDLTTSTNDHADVHAAIAAAISGNPNLAYNSVTGTITFTSPSDGASMPPIVIDLSIVNDAFVEGPENYSIRLSNPGSTTGTSSTISAIDFNVTTTINDTVGAGLGPDQAAWSIVGDTTVGEGSVAQYTVSLAGMFGAGETAEVNLVAADVDTTSSDYANFVAAVNASISGYAGSGTLAFDGTTLTFTSGSDGDAMTDLVIDLTAIDDTVVEGDEDYTVSISAAGSSTGADVVIDGTSSVTTTITDNDSSTWSVVGVPSVGEGATAQYTVALTGAIQDGETATIDLGLADVDTNSTDYANFVAAVNAAVSGRSDLTFDGTTLTYTGDGMPMLDLLIDLGTVDDLLIEGDEDFTVSISNPGSTTGSGVAIGGSNSVTTTILDNDAAAWSISGDPTVAEGATAEYTVALAGTLQSGEVATIDLGLADVDTTSADYANFVAAVNAAVSGRSDLAFDGTTLTYTGDGSPMVDLVIDLVAVDDTLTEGNEDYEVSIANSGSSTGGSLSISSPNTVTTTIVDDDVVQWSIVGDTTVDEGGSAQYTIELAGVLQAGEDAIVQLDFVDLETNSADYSAFATAVQTAIGSRTDLSFDATTGQLTATGTGSPMVNLVIDLDAIDDAFIEGPERYQLMLSNPNSTTGTDSGIDPARNLVTTTINDTVGDGGVLEEAVWSLGVDQTVPEGSPGAYTLALSGVLQAGEVVTVDLGISDIDTVSGDYASFNAAMVSAAAAYAGPGSVAWGGTTFTFTSDGTGAMAPLAISLGTINDAFAEGTEDFLISLSDANSLSGAATSIDATQDDAVTTIDDTIGAGADDVTFEIVGDTTVDEGGTATYTVTTTGGLGAGQDASVELSIGDIDTNSADYAGFNAAVAAAAMNYNTGSNPGSVAWDGTTLTFTAAVDGDELTGLVIDLGAVDDAFLEGPEVYDVSLANAGSASGVTAGVDAIQNIVVTTINDTDGDGGPVEPGGEWSLVGGGVVDEGNNANFTIGLTGNLQAGESTSVQISLSDIETVGSDYGVFSTAVTNAVAAYNASATNSGSLAWDGTSLTFTSDGSGPMNDLPITLATIDDLAVEGDERFNVAISNPLSTTGLSPSVSSALNLATTTIVDIDSSEWEITGDTSVAEGASAQYTIALSGTLQSGETAAIDLGIADVNTTSTDYANFVSAVNAAIAGRSDLAFDGTTLTYTGDGTPMADVVVDLGAIDDTTIEGDEDYTVSISNPGSTTGSDVGVGGSTSVTTTITDNDAATWSITGDMSVGEGAVAQYTVSLAGTIQSGETATIDLGLADVDTMSADYVNFVAAVNAAIAGRSDLAFNGTTLTFTGDGNPMLDLVIDLTAIDDVLVEGDEDYRVSISNPGSTTGSDIAVGGTTEVTTTITDNDIVTWSISGDAVVAEGSVAQYVVALTGTIQAAETATIDLGLADVDTTSADYANFVSAVNAAIVGRSDLTFDGTTLTFTGDGNPMPDLVVDLTAIDDVLIEGDEDYRVSISNPGSTTGGSIAVGTDIAITTITDDDSATWSITGDPVVPEGAIARYTVSLSETLQVGETATIDLSLSNIDTTSSDYANFVTTVNSAIAGRSDLAFDGTTLAYTGDGSPMADVVIEVTAVNDSVIEGPEDYRVAISNPGSTTGSDITAGGTTSVITTITDDDVVTWSITGDATVGEGNVAQYTVTLNGTLQSGESAIVDLGLTDVDTDSVDYANFVMAVNTAVAGRSDLSFDGTTLTYIGDGNPMVALTIDLQAIDDMLIEGDEDYTVSLANPGSLSGSDVQIGGTTSVATSIIDNDNAIWSLTGDPTVAEGAVAQYTVSLAGLIQFGETATIDLGLTDIDTSSTDYANFVAAVNTAIAGRSELSFDGTTLTYTGDGNPMANVVIDLAAIDDGLIEGDEDYRIDINNPGSTTGSDVRVSTANTVTTTITDNDIAAWSIIGDTAVAEGDVAQYTVLLSGTIQTGETAVVDLDLANIDTTSTDYGNFVAAINAAVSSRTDLTFDGVSLTYTGDGNPMDNLVIDLMAVNDVIVEGAEDYVISISNPRSTTGGDVVTSLATSVTTTISDDDIATWSLTGDTTVTEGGTANYIVALSGVLQAGETATIELGLGDVDTNSSDYANFVSTVSLAIAGRSDLAFDGTTLTYTGDGMPMSDLRIDLPTIDDVLSEATELYDVSLVGPGSTSGSTVVGSGLVTTSIEDDDALLWSITGTSAVDEGGVAQYKVSLAGAIQTGEQASVQLAVADLDTSSADYSNFVNAVQTAVAARSDLSFDAATGTLTVTGSGSPMMDLCVDVSAIDDAFVEGPERIQVSLSNATSPTSLATGIDPALSLVTTTINDTVGIGGALEQAIWSLGVDQTVPEGSPGSYLLSLSGDLQAGEIVSIDLTLADIDTTSSDYANFSAAISDAISVYSGPGTFAWNGTTLEFTSDGSGPMAGLPISLGTTNDVIAEGTEDFLILLSNANSSTGVATAIDVAADDVTTTIDDTIGPGSEDVIWNLIGDISVDEGGTASYLIGLDGALGAGEVATVEISVADLETVGADYDIFDAAVATAVGAYAGPGNLVWDGTTLVFTAANDGDIFGGIEVELPAIDDVFLEGPERFLVSLANSGSTTGIVAGIDATENNVVTTINDTEGDGGPAESGPEWSLTGTPAVIEGAPATYSVVLSGTLQAGESTSVALTLGDIETGAVDYDDFNLAVVDAVAAYNANSANSGSFAWDGVNLTFTGDGSGPMSGLDIELGTVQDSVVEGDERLNVMLANPSSTTGLTPSVSVAQGVVTTTIVDDDVTNWNIVGDTNLVEGSIAQYTVLLGGTLQAGEDASIDLTLSDVDTTSADYASFVAAVNAAIAGRPDLSFDGTTLTYVADGNPMADLIIGLSTIDDLFIESDEDFTVSISNPGSSTGSSVSTGAATQVTTAITDNDSASWSLVGDTSVPEGSVSQYTISLTGTLQSGETSTIDLGLGDIDTTSIDYASFAAAVNAAIAGRSDLTFDGTTLTYTGDGIPMSDVVIDLTAIDDVLVEGSEDFTVAISNAGSTTGGSAVLGSPVSVTTTIEDNDAVTWSISGDATVAEGSLAQYTVALEGTLQVGETASIDIGLSDLDTSSSDYANFVAVVNAAVAGRSDLSFDGVTLTYAGDGNPMADLILDLPIISDGVSEPPEDFMLALSNPASSTSLPPIIDPAAGDVTTTINGSPILQPDSGFTSINTPYNGNVLGNDSDPDGDALTVTHVDGQPIGVPIVTDCGTVVMNPDGTFTFTPNPGFYGVDTFTYTVVDSAGNAEISTVEITVNNAAVGVAKEASDAAVNGENWDITFTLTMENLGNVPLNNLTLSDDVAAIFGDAFVAVSTPMLENFVGIGAAPTLNASWSNNTAQSLLAGGVLEVGASFEVTFTVTVDPDAGGVAQPLGNQAEGSGQGINPDGSPMLDSNGDPAIASDLSDDGSNPAGENGSDNNDGVFGNDVTQIVIADLGIAKAIVGEPELLFSGNYVVTYQVVVENTGTVALANLSLLEDLSIQFGDAFVQASGLSIVSGTTDPASSIAVDSGFDGDSNIELMNVASTNVLVPGDSFTVRFTVEVDPLATMSPIGNQISGSGGAVDADGNPILDSNGDPVVGSDLSDSGNDPGGTNPDDPNDTGSSSDSTLFDPPALPLGEISGVVFIDSNNNGVRDLGEDGIEGVEVTLEGVDAYGDPVSIVILSDANGQYRFTDLNAGTYRLSEAQPAGFSDGADNGEPGWIVGDDEFSNIVLNWGQTFTNSSFGERLTGTSGFPPNFPTLGPIFVANVGSLLDAYASSSSPIYSGIAIGSNANPLWLVSGRLITGGYSVDNVGDGGCPVEVDPCCDTSAEPEMTFEEIIEESCEVECDAEEVVLEEGVPCEEVCEPNEPELDCPPQPRFLRGSFLKRMANWLKR